MAAICLMRTDRLSAPPMSCLLFFFSFIISFWCFLSDLCTWTVRSHLTGSTVFKPKQQRKCEMPDAGECYFSFYQAAMLGLMHVVLRSLGFTETSLCRVSSRVSLDDSGVKSEVSQWNHICCRLCSCNINSREWFVNIWSNVRTLSGSFSTFITKTKTKMLAIIILHRNTNLITPDPQFNSLRTHFGVLFLICLSWDTQTHRHTGT